MIAAILLVASSFSVVTSASTAGASPPAGQRAAVAARHALVPSMALTAVTPRTALVAPALEAPALAARALVAPTRARVYQGGVLGNYSRTIPSVEQFSSAAVGNVTGHRDGDTDVVAAYLDGTVHVWSVRTGRQEFVIRTEGPISASPALIKLRASWSPSVLISTDTGNVYIYNLMGGRVTTIFHQRSIWGTGIGHGFFGTPTIADLDRNGKKYVIATSWDQHLYAWDLGGHPKPGFPFFAQDTIWSSPTVATLDGDPYPEIIFGYDCTGIPAERCYQRWHTYGGVVTAIKHNGQVAAGWPVLIPHEVVWSTPAVASLRGTAAKQVVVGTGLYFGNGAGQNTYVFDAHGHRLAAMATYGRPFSSPAIGDVFGLGRPQIAIGSEHGLTDVFDSSFNRRAHLCTAPSSSGCTSSHSSPIIGDLYGNGQQEVVAVGSNSFHLIDRTGRSVVNVQIPETALGLAAAPTLVNIDNRATLFFTLMAHGAGGSHAEVVSYTFPTKAGPSAWPAFKGNMARSGSAGAKYVPIPVS